MRHAVPLFLCCLVCFGCTGNSSPSTDPAPDEADTLLPLHADEPAEIPNATSSRFSVSTEILPGQISMTLLYITDAQTNELHIYRAVGGLDTSFKGDPELYRTFDLTSVGQKTLKQAE